MPPDSISNMPISSLNMDMENIRMLLTDCSLNGLLQLQDQQQEKYADLQTDRFQRILYLLPVPVRAILQKELLIVQKYAACTLPNMRCFINIKS